MPAGDSITATVGSHAQNVAVGQEIDFRIGASDVSDKDKLSEVYRLVWEIRERVSILRTWLVALTVGVGLMALIGLYVMATGG